PATLVDAQTGEVVRRFGRKHEPFCDSAFSPNGKLLACASDALDLWELETGKEVYPCTAHRACVRSMVFSPDGKALAALDRSERLLLWSSATAKVLNPESILAEGPVCTYAFSLGGKALTVIENDGTVRVWDVATSKKVRQFHLPVGEDEKHCEKLDH